MTVEEFAELQKQAAHWKADAERLRSVLEDIAEPMRGIQEEARISGYKIDGVAANELCRDANWLREKARKALTRGEIER